ncbi:MAG: hypothetical protein ACREOE_19150 [Gemmatimonadales bacterium]
MRADLSQAALETDLVLQASSDQALLSNVYNVTKYINPPVCPTYVPIDCSGTSGSGSGSGFGPGNTLGDDGGVADPASPTGHAESRVGGCAVSAGDARGSWFGAGVAVLVGVGSWRRRRQRATGRDRVV